MRTIDKLVLELRGDGSRTPVVGQPRFRVMEAVWFLIAAALFVAHLESSDISNQVIAQKVTLAKQERENCQRYAKAITHLLNHGGVLEVTGSTQVSCKAPKHLEAS
jgi:hypothetical protein